jgi:hypothetical protein
MSYSVYDKRDYELDQLNRSKAMLKKRNRIKVIKQNTEDYSDLDGVLQHDSIASINRNIDKCTKYLFDLMTDFTFKKVKNGKTTMWSTKSIFGSSNIYTNINRINLILTNLNSDYIDLLKNMDVSKINDYKIIIKSIEQYFSYWNEFYNRFGFKFYDGPAHATDNMIPVVLGVKVATYDITKDNYFPLNNITDSPPVVGRTLIARYFKSSVKGLTVSDLFYPIIGINFQSNKILKRIYIDLTTFIAKSSKAELPQDLEKIKSGSGLAVPYQQSLKDYVQNHSQDMPKRFY